MSDGRTMGEKPEANATRNRPRASPVEVGRSNEVNYCLHYIEF